MLRFIVSGRVDPLVGHDGGSRLDNAYAQSEQFEMFWLVWEVRPSRKDTDVLDQHNIQNKWNFNVARLEDYISLTRS